MQQIKRKRGGQIGNRNAVGHGAPLKNQNAVGHRASTPTGNINAVKHGLYSRRILTEEDQEILDEICNKRAIDVLWECISLQRAAIIRAQKIMYVKDCNNHTRTLIGKYNIGSVQRNEYTVQFALDKQAAFLEIQSTAMNALNLMIGQYDKMLYNSKELDKQAQQLRIERLKALIARQQLDVEHVEDDFVKAVMEGGRGDVK